MKSNFELLGLDETATKEEVDKAYKKLKNKYSKDRFLEGEDGNRAARNLTKLETAYQELCDYFKEETFEEHGSSYLDVENEIKNGNYDGAQRMLDSMTDRNSEWHYLQSVVFYKKNWLNESKKQLEIALSLEPNNPKYNDSYAKLRKIVEGNSQRFSNQNNYNNNAYSNNNVNDRQMGGTDCGSCVDCCATYCCLQLLCGGCR